MDPGVWGGRGRGHKAASFPHVDNSSFYSFAPKNSSIYNHYIYVCIYNYNIYFASNTRKIHISNQDIAKCGPISLHQTLTIAASSQMSTRHGDIQSRYYVKSDTLKPPPSSTVPEGRPASSGTDRVPLQPTARVCPPGPWLLLDAQCAAVWPSTQKYRE